MIARNYRKLRIEVGAGYKHESDNECEKIIQSNIIKYFKNGKYSEGIYSGVFALDKLVRTKEHFHIISNNYFIDGLLIALGIIVVLCIISFIRTGKRGVAGSMLSMIFVSPFQGIFIGSDYHIGNNYYRYIFRKRFFHRRIFWRWIFWWRWSIGFMVNIAISCAA